MKYNIKTLFICCLVILLNSCKDDLPDNPTIMAPISALEMTVSGIDYLAVPKLNEDKTLDNTMLLTVRIPNENAIIKSLHLSNGLTTNIKEGDVVTFKDDILPITITSQKGENYTCYIKMDYTEPSILYFVKSSDKDSDGNNYYLDINKSQRLASLNSDNKYEGFIDLTASNWDNICLVASDLKAKYHVDGGWWPERSSGSFVLKKETTSGSSNHFSSLGPWADWRWANNNSQIQSSGVWKFDFNVSTGELVLLETQWAINGTAVGKVTAMTYNAQTKKWNLRANLKAGNLRFVTIPVTEGDTTLSYGELGSTTVTGYIESQGRDIKVEEEGNYDIVIDLSTPPYYSYSVTKN